MCLRKVGWRWLWLRGGEQGEQRGGTSLVRKQVASGFAWVSSEFASVPVLGSLSATPLKLVAFWVHQ